MEVLFYGNWKSYPQSSYFFSCLIFQVLRSADRWSTGTCESSILNAYIETIEKSEHFIYIEVTQYKVIFHFFSESTLLALLGQINRFFSRTTCLLLSLPHTVTICLPFECRTSFLSAVLMERRSIMGLETQQRTGSCVHTGMTILTACFYYFIYLNVIFILDMQTNYVDCV